MTELITEHFCITEMIKKFPGIAETFQVPINVNFQTGELTANRWALKMRQTLTRKKTSYFYINYCPICGAKLDPNLVGELSVSEKLVKDFEEFHPRAVKLLKARKPFVVVSCTEVYYPQVYAIIRATELANGTWTSGDQQAYEYAIADFNKAHSNET